MSKLTKIYDGMVFSLSTGEVLEHGTVTYHAEEDITHCGGGGPSKQTTTTGSSEAYKPQVDSMLADAKSLYDSGQLGQVAGFTQTGINAQNAGIGAAGKQQSLENSMFNTASNSGALNALQGRTGMTGTEQNLINASGDTSALNALQGRTGMTGTEQSIIAQAGNPVDLSGMRASALQQAQGALGTSQAAAGQRGGLGGSRQALNQASIEQGLAANFAGIDQQAQQMQDQRLGAAANAEQGQFGRLQAGLQGQAQNLQNLSTGVNAEQGQFGRLQSGLQGQSQQIANMGNAMGAQGQGAQTLGMIGQAQQAQNQAQADAPYTALAQRVGLFSGLAPKEQNTTKTGGK